MFDDPFYGKENGEDDDDRKEGSQKAHKSHACGTLSIDEPDQTNSNNEQQNESAQR
jgi:hypothetical protein